MSRVLFPAFLDLVHRRVLVVGAGRTALAKIVRLLNARADIVVVAPDAIREVEWLPVTIRRRPFRPDDLDGVWYVVAAAPHEVNRCVVREASSRGVFVNAVDDPANATAFAGSVFTRGPVTVALSTGGDAPALSRLLREALERLIGRDVEQWTTLAVTLRDEWKRTRLPLEQRRHALLAALAHLHTESNQHRDLDAPPATGVVSLVGAGPGDPDLLTRKAARRLAEADLVLYDALVSSAAVSVATRAQLVMVGRRSGSETMGQKAIIRTLIRATRRGKRVVRLKGGDPFVFGRGGEEALALRAAGVEFEIVPGVSSAFAAAAAAAIPITHRGVSSAVLVTTGHDIERFAHAVRSIEPNATTVVVMMGLSHRAEIGRTLIAAGWRASTSAAIIADATLPHQTVWTGTVAGLAKAPDTAAPGTIVIGEVVALRDGLLRGWSVSQGVCNA